MITLPVTCKTIVRSVTTVTLILWSYMIFYGISVESIVVAAIGAWLLFATILALVVWYGYNVVDFFGRHVKCKCDGSG